MLIERARDADRKGARERLLLASPTKNFNHSSFHPELTLQLALWFLGST